MHAEQALNISISFEMWLSDKPHVMFICLKLGSKSNPIQLFHLNAKIVLRC